jgi:hypothetical protein
VDMMVLCQCRHPSGLHTENGCRAGRYQPCYCRLNSQAVIETATAAVRIQTPTWRESQCDVNTSKQDGR